jgi:ribosomal protein L17
MRHQNNKLLELRTGEKTKSVFIRQLLTNLIKNGKIVTTAKRAKVLKAEANFFFARLVRLSKTLEAKDAKRECDRFVKSIIYGEAEGKMAVSVYLPRYIAE